MRCFCRSCFLVREKIFNSGTLCSLGEKNKLIGHDRVFFEIFGHLRKMRWHVRCRTHREELRSHKKSFRCFKCKEMEQVAANCTKQPKNEKESDRCALARSRIKDDCFSKEDFRKIDWGGGGAKLKICWNGNGFS